MGTIKSGLYSFIAFILVFSITLNGFGQNTSVNSAANLEFQNLLTLANEVSTGEYGDSQIQKVAEKVAPYVADPKNKALLNTPSGRDLITLQTKFINYLSLKKSFEQCGSKNLEVRNMDQRILNAARSSNVVDVPMCTNPFSGKPTVPQAMQMLEIAAKATGNGMGVLEDEVYDQTMINAMNTYIHLEYLYSKSTPMSPIGFIATKVCPYNTCSNEMRVRLEVEGKKFLNEIKQTVKPLSLDEAKNELNSRINILNQKMKEIPSCFGYYGASFMKSMAACKTDPRRQNAIKNYSKSYFYLSSSGNGLLFNTDAIHNTVDSVRQPKSKQGKFPQHATIQDSKVIQSAILEAKAKVLENSNKFNSLHNKSSKEISDTKKLKEILEENPVAFGQVLLANPHLANSACAVMNELAKDEENKKTTRKVIAWGCGIVGGVALITGVGTLLGAELLAEAGLSAAAIGAMGTIGSTAAVVTSAVGVGNAIHSQFEHYEQEKEFETAYFSGSSDVRILEEAREEYLKYKQARFETYLQLGLTATNLRVFASLLKSIKTGKTIVTKGVDLVDKMTALRRGGDFLNQISKDAEIAKLIKANQAILGEEKTAKYLAHLANMEEAERATLLANMRSWDSKKFVYEANKALKQAAKAEAQTQVQSQATQGSVKTESQKPIVSPKPVATPKPTVIPTVSPKPKAQLSEAEQAQLSQQYKLAKLKPTEVNSAQAQYTPANLNETSNFLGINKYHQANKLSEPVIELKDVATAKQYISNFKPMKDLGFDVENLAKWQPYASRMEKSIFYKKNVGWTQKMPDGSYARVRLDYEPLSVPNSKGLHFNVESSVKFPDGKSHTYKYAIKLLCGNHMCSESEALKMLESIY